MVAKGVTVDLEALRLEMRKAKEEERPSRAPSLREAVKVLLPEIDGLRRARWSDAQVAEWLGKRGLAISPGTLAQYLREARKSAPESGGEHKPRKTAKGSADTSKGSAEPVPEGQGDIVSFISEKTKANTETPKVSEQKPAHTPNAAAAATTKRRVNDDA